MICCNDDHANQPFLVYVTLSVCDHIYEGPGNSHKIWVVRKVSGILYCCFKNSQANK